ncbi:MAG: DegV family EDD domain-containing protein [Clostridia bacterium]|nr:DegV family EDD domain-containing protein [Clostridia bacterium]
MNNFAIIPDSSGDVTKSLRDRFGIEEYIRGIVYMPDGTQVFADVDWETMTPKEYYESMKGRKILYKTATPSVGEIVDVFEPVLKSGRDILSISLSSGISGTYKIVKGVADDLLKKYPERKIICIDSLRYSAAILPLIVHADMKRKEGASIEETAQYLESIKNNIHQMGSLDDLFFCVKTGRISNFKAFFGTLIGVNTLADFSNQGLSSVLGKVKGQKAALETTVEYIEKTIVNPQEQIIFVGHSNRDERAEMLAEMIRETIKPKEVIITSVGMACGASIGPGLCAAYYFGEHISDGEEKEREILNDIIKNSNKKRG